MNSKQINKIKYKWFLLWKNGNYNYEEYLAIQRCIKDEINKPKKSFFHFHQFNIPFASMYISFNTRNIIYKCKCGKKKSFIISKDFGDPFPMKTTHNINEPISKKQFKKILLCQTN